MKKMKKKTASSVFVIIVWIIFMLIRLIKKKKKLSLLFWCYLFSDIKVLLCSESCSRAENNAVFKSDRHLDNYKIMSNFPHVRRL